MFVIAVLIHKNNSFINRFFLIWLYLTTYDDDIGSDEA